MADGPNIALRRNQPCIRTSPRSSAKLDALAQLRRLQECGQVAAVCFRIRAGTIEFLLVRTRSGRWIFPKGNTEPGLTHAQAAAIEAFEEAGVHGRIEEECFIRYSRRKGGQPGAPRSAENQSVNAHLCEVTGLERPPEAGRNPTWFSAEKAVRRLREDRSRDYAAELVAVVESAVSRIRQRDYPMRDNPMRLQAGGTQKVQFIDVRRSWKPVS